MKIRPLGAEFFHVDGQTDITKLIVAFRNSENTPEMYLYMCMSGMYLEPRMLTVKDKREAHSPGL
jgi:hypothetical protein